MHVELEQQTAFYLTGQETPKSVEATILRPALMAGYRDLTKLRYDFPLVLLSDAGDVLAEPLSVLVNRVLDVFRNDDVAERLRIHALQLEREIRALLAARSARPLGDLLDAAAIRLGSLMDAKLADSAHRLKAALPVTAEVLDCDAAMPTRFVEHVWSAVERTKAKAFRRHTDHLIHKLGEILRADFAGSEMGRSAPQLKASVGGAFEDAFDFDAMSRTLSTVRTESPLTDARRQRIEATLAMLGSQRFYAAEGAGTPFDFRFDDCATALAAFRKRAPAMLELTRAMTAAELEIEGELSGPRHRSLLRQLGESRVDARDLTLFPYYVVCINARDLKSQYGDLMEILTDGLPVKLLVQDDDLLEEPLDDTGHLIFGSRSPQLAQMAAALNDVFVLQSTSSNLVRYHDWLLKAMRYSGPALISVFSGATETSNLSAYLTAAAALESRTFPAFACDPSSDGARLALDGNPQPERDWPIHALAYEDAGHQRATEDIAFTFVDFVACDSRYAGHFVTASAQSKLAPVADCIDNGAGPPDRLPSIPMIDDSGLMRRVIVDARLMREAHRCRAAWISLQQLGLRTSEENALQEPVAPSSAAPATPPPEPSVAPVQTPMEPVHTNEAYIETVRCSSCNECITINSKMFAYNENQQAYIVDVNAGTYRQLVEAAESCQVAVIHPGKPRNPNEPDLEELQKRAEAFL